MKLKRVLLASVVALSFSFSTPAPAKADPVTAFIVTSVAGITAGTTAAAIATFVVNSALYTAASLAIGKITGALSGKNKQAIQERQASVTSLSLGEAPREAVIGMTAVGGSLVDVWNWGGKYGTDNVTRCIALADHAVENLYGYFVDDVFCLYHGNGVQPGFGGTLTVEFRNAEAGGHAPPSYASANGWAEGDRMTAVTHVWVTTKFDEKVWTQGHPKFRWVMHGLRAFDPRNGDVWADRSTHSFTRNPTMLRYAIARGIYAEGRQGEPEHLLIGRGLTAEEAPPERLIAPANLCDEAVNGLSRYYTDGVISADMDFVTVEQLFADAMAGVIIQHEGGVEVEPGQAKAVVATITDADLVVGEPVIYSEFLPDSDGGRINTVIPRYIDPAQGYVDHSGPVRRDPADLIKDGGPRETTLSLPIVTGAAVADRNAEITRRLARLERRASIVLPAWFGWLEEGDWIAWQSDRRHGGATRRYRIEGWTLGKEWRMRLSLREIASSVFGVPDPIEDTAEPPPPPVPIDALILPGGSAEAITLAGETSAVPAIRFTWDTPVDDGMRAVRAEVRVAGDTDASPTRFEDLASGVGIATNGVGADQVLQARLVPIGDPSRPVLPSAWFTVSTASLFAGDVSPTGPTIQQLTADIADVFGDVSDVSGELAAAVISLSAADAALNTAIAAVDTDLDGVASIVSGHTTQIAGKASQTSLNAQITRIDGVETVNATQATQIIDLNTGKVSNTEYNTLKAEVTAGRNGQPSLSGELQRLNSVDLDLQANKASVTSVTALAGRTSATEADIIDLEIAVAGEATARAQAIQLVEARRSDLPNLLINSNFATDTQHWTCPNWFRAVDADFGPYLACATAGDQYAVSNRVAVTGGATYVYSLPLISIGANIGVYCEAFRANGTPTGPALGLTFPPSGGLSVRRNGPSFTVPSDAATIHFVLWKPNSVSFVAVGKIMLNSGSIAQMWRDDRAIAELNASVTTQSLAIIDLETQQALAYYEVAAAASGGKPARLGLISSSLGSAVALEAPYIYFGDNTVFDDASDTIQTTWGSTRRVIAWGDTFGSDDLVEWKGPSGISPASMTKANANFWQTETDWGPKPADPFTVTVSPPAATTSGPAGTLTSPPGTISATCTGGTSGATVQWIRIDGATDVTVIGPASFTPQFQATLTAGQTKTVTYMVVVTKGGVTAPGYHTHTFQETS